MDISGFIQLLDFTLNTKRKRHIAGGLLLSVSMLFGGLALTTMTLQEDSDANDEEDYDERIERY